MKKTEEHCFSGFVYYINFANIHNFKVKDDLCVKENFICSTIGCAVAF